MTWKHWSAIVAGSVLVGGLLAWWMLVDHQTFAAAGQWVGALGSVAAIAVALGIAHRDWRRADAERRDSEKAQARQIWPTVVLYPKVANSSNDPVGAVVVANDSHAPIFHVGVDRVTGPINMDGSSFSASDRSVRIEAGQKPTFDAPQFRVARFPAEAGITADAFTVSVRFMDASQRWWLRTGVADPVRTDSEGNPLDHRTRVRFGDLS